MFCENKAGYVSVLNQTCTNILCLLGVEESKIQLVQYCDIYLEQCKVQQSQQCYGTICIANRLDYNVTIHKVQLFVYI